MRWLLAAMLMCSCTSVHVTRWPDGFETDGRSKGLVQVNRSTLTLFLDYIDVVDIGLETVSKTLLEETKALGGKPRLLSARTSPRGGWWALACLLVCINSTELVAAVEEPEAKP